MVFEPAEARVLPSGEKATDETLSACPSSIAHVAITQLVGDIPSHGLNDKKMIEMTTFEEFGLLGRELGHADDYP